MNAKKPLCEVIGDKEAHEVDVEIQVPQGTPSVNVTIKVNQDQAPEKKEESKQGKRQLLG